MLFDMRNSVPGFIFQRRYMLLQRIKFNPSYVVKRLERSHHDHTSNVLAALCVYFQTSTSIFMIMVFSMKKTINPERQSQVWSNLKTQISSILNKKLYSYLQMNPNSCFYIELLFFIKITYLSTYMSCVKRFYHVFRNLIF